MRSAVVLASLIALPSALALSGHRGDKPLHHGRHAAQVARELDTVTNSTEDVASDVSTGSGLSKRAQFNGVRMTWFVAGVGNCGTPFTANDFVVAISTHQWEGGSHCYKPITIEFEGRKVQASVADQCMGCPDGAIDLTEGLFKAVAPNGDGQIAASWSYGSGEDKPEPPPKPSTTSTKEKPTPTPTPPPPPPPSTTSTKEKPTTTSTPPPPPPSTTSEKKPDPTTTSSTSSSKKPDPTTTSTSSSAKASTAEATTSATAASLVGAPSPSANPASGLEQLNQAYLGIAGLVAEKTIKQ